METNFIQHSISTKAAIARASGLGRDLDDRAAEWPKVCFGKAVDRCIRQSGPGYRVRTVSLHATSCDLSRLTKEA